MSINYRIVYIFQSQPVSSLCLFLQYVCTLLGQCADLPVRGHHETRHRNQRDDQERGVAMLPRTSRK
jgi:hypothetical protein